MNDGGKFKSHGKQQQLSVRSEEEERLIRQTTVGGSSG